MLKRIRQIFQTKSQDAGDESARVRELLLQTAGAKGIRFCEASDLTGRGRFGEEWLAITDNEVIVCTVDKETVHLLHRLDVSALRSAGTTMLTGCGMLSA